MLLGETKSIGLIVETDTGKAGRAGWKLSGLTVDESDAGEAGQAGQKPPADMTTGLMDGWTDSCPWSCQLYK